MKNIIIRSAILISSLALLCGCKDFLDPDTHTVKSGWTTKADFEDAIAGLYAHPFDAEGSETVSGVGQYTWEFNTEDVTLGRSGYPLEGMIHDMNWVGCQEARSETTDIWRMMYIINARANRLIFEINDLFDSGEAHDMTEAFRQRAIGDALFNRAFSMLRLAPYYGDARNGGIPIILENTPAEQVDVLRPTNVLANYDQIISDLRNAADKVPFLSQMPTAEYGRAHKAACWGFAARAALYAAKYDAKYYDVVIEMCDNIINISSKPGASAADMRDLVTTPGLYLDASVRPAYANLFTVDNNYSKEYIWSWVGDCNTVTRGPQFYAQGMNNGGWSFLDANTYGKVQPTYNLYQAYESGDTRRDATILLPGQTFYWFGEKAVFGGTTTIANTRNGKTAGNPQEWTISSSTGMTFRKFMHPFETINARSSFMINCAASRPKSRLGVVLMRYAEVLLMKSEALIAKNGEGDPTAKGLINQVRTRAGLTANSGATWAQLKHERRIEFAGEYQPSRFLDVIRWGDAGTEMSKSKYGVTHTAGVIQTTNKLLFGPRTYDPNVNNVLPIPRRAFNGTKNLRQNNGYE